MKRTGKQLLISEEHQMAINAIKRTRKMTLEDNCGREKSCAEGETERVEVSDGTDLSKVD